MKLVVNRCYGGFGLSDRAIELYMTLKGWGCHRYLYNGEKREYCKIAKAGANFVSYFKQDITGLSLGEVQKHNFYERDIPRDCPVLVQIVEQLGKDAWGSYAELEVVEIPDGVDWEISDYDGVETIHEKHRSW